MHKVAHTPCCGRSSRRSDALAQVEAIKAALGLPVSVVGSTTIPLIAI
jgi:hypothetical protein